MKVREGYYSEQVRNEALQSILDTLNNRQKQVYDIIRKWQPIDNERIAKHLGVYPHLICPRVKELRELGIVEFVEKSVSEKSMRPVSLWRINPEGRQLSLF